MAAISRNVVRKAGDVLINPESSAEMLREATNTLNEWRMLHTEPMRAMSRKLSTAITKKYKGAVLGQRIKRTPAILDKLSRNQSMKLDRIQDIAGVRVILDSIDKVESFDAYVTKSRGLTRYTGKFKNYIEHPKSTGYRSIHRIFKYSNETRQESDGLLVELQIRTKLQHAWATAVETLGLIDKYSYKTGEGDEIHKKFFELAGELLAIKQGTARGEKYESLDRKQIAQELMAIDSDLKITGKLEGIAVSTKQIKRDFNRSSAYHLLLLDTARKKTAIQSFSAEFESLVPTLYTNMERETADNPNLSVVLISVKNLNELKTAYPNYFLDTKYFLEAIKSML